MFILNFNDFFKLTADLQKIEEITRTDFNSVSNRGDEIRKQPRKQDNEFNEQIEKVISKLDRGLLTIKEFLVIVATKGSEPIENGDDMNEVLLA